MTMAAKVSEIGNTGRDGSENIAYIRQLVGELRRVAHQEQAEMLCYFLEMAYLEAGDVLHARRAKSGRHN